MIADRWSIGEQFTIDEVYEHEEHFSALHPDNHHVREKLRQTLQHLRDAGAIEFVDDHGTYRRVQ